MPPRYNSLNSAFSKMRFSFFRRSMLALAALLVAFIIIIAPIAYVYVQQDQIARSNLSAFTTFNNVSTEAIAVSVKLTLIDYISSTYKVHIVVYPYNTSVPGTLFDANNFPKVPINLFFKETTIPYVVGKPIPPYDMTTGFGDGDSSYYPFDLWTDQIYIEAWSTTNNANATYVNLIPLYVDFDGNIPITEVNTMWTAPTTNAVQIGLSVRRSVTTKAFSVFVIILMWLLSLSTIGVAYEIVIGGREIVPPNMAAAAALLFAIVNVRNAQPGVPPVGILIDICGYFWNVALIAIATIMITVTWVYRWSPKPVEVKKNVEPEVVKSTILDIGHSKP